MRQPFSVLVYPVRVIDNNWEYLLLKRIARPDLALLNCWQGVTGSLEEGENIMQAAVRELAEETRFTPYRIEQIDFSYSFPIEDKWRKKYGPEPEKVTEYAFIAFVDGQQEPKLSEHDQWQWCNTDKALKLLHYPENIEALKQCDKYLQLQLDL